MRPVGAVSVAGGEIVYGTTDRPELVWMAGDGTVRQIARWDAPTVDVGDEEWAAYERGYRQRYADRYPPAELERRLSIRRDDFSGTPPHFGWAFGDRDGRVWLTPYRFSGSASRSSTYTVVARDGRYLGGIEFPRAIRLLDISGDMVLGVEYDEFDVQAVALYRLQDRS